MINQFHKIIWLFSILVLFSCDTKRIYPPKEFVQNTDSLALLLYTSNDYSKFRNSYLFTRDEFSNVFHYYNQNRDLEIIFKRNKDEIIIDDLVRYQTDTSRTEETNIDQTDNKIMIEKIYDLCRLKDEYDIRSFWGVFPDSSAEKISFTFNNYEVIYFRRNDSNFKKNNNLRLNDTIYLDSKWVLLK